jgi:hypothetical protein
MRLEYDVWECGGCGRWCRDEGFYPDRCRCGNHYLKMVLVRNEDVRAFLAELAEFAEAPVTLLWDDERREKAPKAGRAAR